MKTTNEEKILNKLSEHDNSFKRIEKKFDEHDKRFNEHDKRFERIDKKLDDHDKQFDRIIKKLVEHDERMDTFVTKQEFSQFRGEMLSGQDKMIKILDRLDTERIFTVRWVETIEQEIKHQRVEIDRHEEMLTGMKLKLKIA